MFGDPTENPNGWTKLNVKEAVKQGYIARPLDGNHGEKHPKGDDYVPEGVPFLMAQDLKDKRVDFTSCHFITEEQASTLKKGWAKEGDVLLTHKGTIGRVAIVQPSQYENMLLTPQITYYRCLKDIDNEYLAAYFMTGFFVEQLERLRTGTTRACVTITQQEQLELIIPPVPMQREFVKFVNQSDKSKFVRFKSQFIEMFGDPYTNPKGWEIGTIEDVMIGKASNGFFAKPADYSSDGNAGIICVGDVVNRKYSNVTGLRRANADDKQFQKFKVQYGDMLFCRSSLVKEGIAKASIVPAECDEDILFECHVIRVRLDIDRVVPEFMQAFTITDYFRTQMMDKSKTATMTTIGQKDVISGGIYIPDMELQKQFAEFAEQSDKSK